MSRVKLNTQLSGEYAVTKKVIGTRFEHSYLGKVDLEKIGPVMAEKLVATGHLKKTTKKTQEPEPVIKRKRVK